jgi:hypothetical protein
MLGGITGVLAVKKHSKLSPYCSGGVCGPDQKADLDNYHTLGTLSTIGFVVGGVGAAAGVVLLLVKPPSQNNDAAGELTSKPRSAINVNPFVGLGSAGVEGTF